MPRQRSLTPTYRFHRQSGQAVSDFYDPLTGAKRMVSLGKFNSPESKLEHARIVAEVAVGRPAGPSAGLSVSGVMLAFMRHADLHYRREDGTHTDELNNFRQVVRLVRETHAHVPAAEFGPLALKAIRQRMIAKGWSRTNINLHVGRVRRMFKFAVENELVPPAVLQGLKAVPGLQKGRTDAKEPEPILPVDDATVNATLPHVSRHVRGMIRLQQLTGCRPGEACRLRRCDIDTTGDVWVYRPRQHKTAHRGKVRLIHLGPLAQQLLAEFPTATPDEHVFSPKREATERHALRAANRKTKFYPSRQGWQDRKAKPKRSPGERYATPAYGFAIRRAVKLANARRERLAGGGAFDPVAEWAPNQLRHTFATRARRDHGLNVAQALLGHARSATTEIYAETTNDLAAEVARTLG